MANNIDNIQRTSFVSYFWTYFLDSPIINVAQAALKSISYLFSRVIPLGPTIALVERDLLVGQHQANTWDCIGYTANEGGGKIYQFRLKEEYRILPHMSDVEIHQVKVLRDQIYENLFPAVEDFGNALPLLIDSQMRLLGYDFQDKEDGFYLYLPDKEALEVQFEKVRKTNPQLQPLKIQSSEGIATDHDFIESYAAGFDALLSSGKEFFHDHIAHVLPTLKLLFSNPQEYYPERQRASQVIKELNEILVSAQQLMEKNAYTEATVHELNQIRAAIAMTIDFHWSPGSLKSLQKLTLKFFTKKDKTSSDYSKSFLRYMDYLLFLKAWEAKFQNNRLSTPDLYNCWNKIYWYVIYQKG